MNHSLQFCFLVAVVYSAVLQISNLLILRKLNDTILLENIINKERREDDE
jgi:hypothetical protein